MLILWLFHLLLVATEIHAQNLCPTGCSVCTSSQCLTCSEGYYLQPNGTTCAQSCPSGYYISGGTACQPCDPSCLTCNGSTQNDCLSCKGNNSPNLPVCANCTMPAVTGYLYLVHIDQTRNYISFTKNNDSTASMYFGFFPKPKRVFHWIIFQGAGSVTLNISASTFKNYYADDITFDGSTVSYQGTDIAVALGQSIDVADITDYSFNITAKTTFVCVGLKASFDESQIPLTAIDWGSSIDLCTDVPDNVVIQPQGSLGSFNCATCTGSPAYCDYCDTGQYLQTDSVTCASTCPAKYWADSFSDSCSSCSSSCANCTGPSHTNCISCASGFYLQPNSTTCLSTCPEEYFQNNETLTCDPCNIACTSCSGSTNTMCQSCQTDFYLQPDLTTCLGYCPSHYYQDDSLQTCEECDTSCQECSSNSSSDCLSCPANLFFNQGTCVSTCPTAFFANSSNNTCLPQPKFQISAPSSMFQCESYASYIIIPTNLDFSTYYANWTINITPSNSDQQSQITNLIAGANTSISILPMTFSAGSTYSFTANISAYNWTESTTVSINASKYSTIYEPRLHSTILSWWQDDGHLIGCISCTPNDDADNTMGCNKCTNGMQLVQGECRCVQNSNYIEPRTVSEPYCRSKTKSAVFWHFIQSYPTVQFNIIFTNDFQEIEENLKFVAQYIGVYFSNRWIEVDEFSAQIQNPSILIEFTPKCQVTAGAEVSVNTSFIDEYNELPFSPFYLEAINLTYVFPNQLYYLDNATNKSVTTASTVVSDAMIIQTATSSLLSIIAGSFATTAIFLVDFVGDVVNYRYINVPFPTFFMLFCQLIDSNFLPDPYSRFSNDVGVENSQIGKFQDFSYSTVMLENSAGNLNRELIALAVIACSHILLLISWKRIPSIGNRLPCVVQIKENTSYGGYPQYSLAMSYLIIISSPVFLILLAYFLNRKASRRNQVGVETETPSNSTSSAIWREIPESISIIAEDFRENCWFNRNFMLVMIIENLVIAFWLAFLQDYGLAQAILYTVTVVIYMALGIKYRPFKEKVQSILFFMNQSCKILMGFVSILFGVHDHRRFLKEDVKNGLATTLMVIIIGTIVTNVLIVLAASLPTILSRCRRKKKSQVQNREPEPLPESLTIRENRFDILQIDPLSPKESMSRNLFEDKEHSIQSSRDGENNFERDAKVEEVNPNESKGWFVDFRPKKLPKRRDDPGSLLRQRTLLNSFKSIQSPGRVHILADSLQDDSIERVSKNPDSGEGNPDSGESSTQKIRSRVFSLDRDNRTQTSILLSPSRNELSMSRARLLTKGSISQRDSLEILEPPLSATKSGASSFRQDPPLEENHSRNPSIELGLDNRAKNPLVKAEPLDSPSLSRRSSINLDLRYPDTQRYKGRSLFSLKSTRDNVSTMTDQYLSSKNLEAEAKVNAVESQCFSLRHLHSPEDHISEASLEIKSLEDQES